MQWHRALVLGPGQQLAAQYLIADPHHGHRRRPGMLPERQPQQRCKRQLTHPGSLRVALGGR